MTRRTAPIVVGVAQEGVGLGGARFAVEEATLRGTAVVLAHAFPPPPAAPGFSSEAYGGLDAGARAVLRDITARLTVPPEVQIRPKVQWGTALSLLRRLAKTAGMVVLGQDRVPVADRLLSGSIASPLAADAECPVVTVPGDYEPGRAQRGPVVVAVDGETAAESALAFAFEEAALRHSDLVLLHAVAPDRAPRDSRDAAVSIAELTAGWRADYPDLVVSEKLVSGEPESVISSVSGQAGLMVVGHPHEHHLGGWSRSVAHAVLRHTGCPLVVAPRTSRTGSTGYADRLAATGQGAHRAPAEP
jgi:nucleotide-binding universal stress UspA family protein